MSSYKTELIIENTTFKVLDSDINYFQHIQNSGLPAGDIAGGTFSVKIESSSGPQFDMLAEWMFSKSQMKKGLVRFYKKDGISKLYDFEFYDAHCINYHEHFDGVNDSAMTTTITVSPGITRIGSLVKERLWKVSELSEMAIKAPIEETKNKHFIKFSLVDSNGQPMENVILNVILPDGSRRTVTSDKFGMIEIKNIKPGECKIVSDWRNVKIDDAVIIE